MRSLKLIFTNAFACTGKKICAMKQVKCALVCHCEELKRELVNAIYASTTSDGNTRESMMRIFNMMALFNLFDNQKENHPLVTASKHARDNFK